MCCKQLAEINCVKRDFFGLKVLNPPTWYIDIVVWCLVPETCCSLQYFPELWMAFFSFFLLVLVSSQTQTRTKCTFNSKLMFFCEKMFFGESRPNRAISSRCCYQRIKKSVKPGQGYWQIFVILISVLWNGIAFDIAVKTDKEKNVISMTMELPSLDVVNCSFLKCDAAVKTYRRTLACCSSWNVEPVPSPKGALVGLALQTKLQAPPN